MNILGYIVTKNKLNNILSCIKVVTSYRAIEDKTKPILIIGLEEAKKHASSFSILEKQINENLFWTFGKREKRSDYEKDIEKFQEYVLQQSVKMVSYYYFNVLTVKMEKIKKLIKIINNLDLKFFYIDKKMVYMFYNGYVMGFSIDIIEYIGVKRNKIIALIQKNDKNKIYFNDFALNFKIKKMIENKRYIIPYFLSLNVE